ncbi:helix-turn-helix domain-containing protein [Gordonia sp. CPCC 205333]|uniref:helix-turn-helix domain-containing protein n=1 Tax=Gordonia sp. CPCC 205333 TaxID=3140790 RepID=UPI003AF387B5
MASIDSQNQPSSIRTVRYKPSAASTGPVELRRIADLAKAAATGEFTGTQRLGFDLILHIESGHTTHEVDFTRYRLGPGDILWAHTGQVQQWGDIHAIDGHALLANADALAPGTHALLTQLGVYSRVHWPAAAGEDSELSQIFDAIKACAAVDADNSSAARDMAIAHLATAAILVLAEAEHSASSIRPPPNERLQQFHTEVDQNFATDRTVEGYAQRLHCSPRTLNRLVRDQTGRSPKDIIDDRVALEARRRLAHEDAGVAAIARSLGFDDPANFTKFFRRRTGLTPEQFRSGYRR